MIGKCGDVTRQMKKLRPDEVLSTLEIEEPEAFEARLLRRYQNVRLPESGYFQLSEKQLKDCKRQFGVKSKIPKRLSEEFSIAFTCSVLFFILAGALFLKTTLSPSLELAFAFAFSALPMWLLFFLGNFGGYYVGDLKLFSSWLNRLRALSLALILSALSYLLFIKTII
ncbi:GIY-YIG nuclease family protein [Prochlorococcus sp. MIT 0603]